MEAAREANKEKGKAKEKGGEEKSSQKRKQTSAIAEMPAKKQKTTPDLPAARSQNFEALTMQRNGSQTPQGSLTILKN